MKRVGGALSEPVTFQGNFQWRTSYIHACSDWLTVKIGSLANLCSYGFFPPSWLLHHNWGTKFAVHQYFAEYYCDGKFSPDPTIAGPFVRSWTLQRIWMIRCFRWRSLFRLTCVWHNQKCFGWMRHPCGGLRLQSEFLTVGKKFIEVLWTYNRVTIVLAVLCSKI